MKDYLDKIQTIKGLVVEETPDSMTKAIAGFDQLSIHLQEKKPIKTCSGLQVQSEIC